MIIVFFALEGIALLAVLPQGWEAISVDFQEGILREVAVQNHSRGRKPSTSRYILHFDNAPVHNTEEIEQALQECKFLRLAHPLYSPDICPCNVFLFDYLQGVPQAQSL
jgi:hypothetical protein